MKLINKIIALFLFMAVLTGTFSSVVIETAYCVQKDYIARVKCENRDKPMAHCNGKCYLKKQLQQDEKRESQGANFEKLELVWFHNTVTATVLVPPVIINEHTDSYSPLLMPGHLRLVYHPPTA